MPGGRELSAWQLSARQSPFLSNISPTQRRTHRLSHRNNGILASRGRILPHVNLDPVGDREPPPSEHHVTIVRDGFVRAGAEGGSQRLCNPFLERITGYFLQL